MIIVVCGLPGSGKTHFASKLSERMGALYVGSDQVREKMGKMGRYEKNDKLLIYEQMAEITADALDHQKSVVADGTFYLKVMRDLFVDLAKLYHTRILFIEVLAIESTVKRRLSILRPDSEADYAVYQLIRQQFEKIEVPHLRLRSGNNNIEKMLEKATHYINEHR